MKDPKFPFSVEVDVAALSRLFANTTTSYKFVFFLSFLDILRRREFQAGEPISFREMIVEMLANSWYPHAYFKLSFGLQDQITSILDSLNLEISQPILKFKDPDKKLLRQTISEQPLDNSLMKYVPYRVLRPFFEQELMGKPDHAINLAIAALAKKYFNNRKPLYRFSNDGNSIVPHPVWCEYLKLHYTMIRDWTAWNWLEYMQRCNQNVPAVSSKLFPPQMRDALNAQAAYWKTVIGESKVVCIYSGQFLTPDNISLDHFLPWSFVAHDQLWNLIPTLPAVNSSKSDCLPSKDYFEAFVQLQHQGLIVTSTHLSSRKWEKLIEPFITDLKLSNSYDLLDHKKLKRAYDANLKPLLELARSLGFAANWQYHRE